MQLLTKAADRLLSVVVPHVTAGACITCPPSWTTTSGCNCVKQSDKNHAQYIKRCSRSGCECQTVTCGPCYNSGIGCKPAT
jgi:hypothetical protein